MDIFVDEYITARMRQGLTLILFLFFFVTDVSAKIFCSQKYLDGNGRSLLQ